MSTRSLVDLSFGISAPAMAVLHALYSQEVSFEVPEVSDVRTAPWYNGREKGIVIVVTVWTGTDDNSLCIAFGEDRNSDHIFVEEWVQNVFMNPPTCPEAANREAWVGSKRKEFKGTQVNQVVNHIIKTVLAFVEERNKKKWIAEGKANAAKKVGAKLRRVK